MSADAVVEAKPRIKCPTWCVTSYEDHLARLLELDGLVIHWSAGDEADVQLCLCAYIDGTPELANPPQIFLEAPDVAFLDEAKKFALRILAAVQHRERHATDGVSQ